MHKAIHIFLPKKLTISCIKPSLCNLQDLLQCGTILETKKTDKAMQQYPCLLRTKSVVTFAQFTKSLKMHLEEERNYTQLRAFIKSSLRIYNVRRDLIKSIACSSYFMKNPEEEHIVKVSDV
jgi:hypothetical protein